MGDDSWLTSLQGSGSGCYFNEMLTKYARKFGRLFVIKTKFEAFAIIYALSLGAVERGIVYLQHYPGWPGKLLALCCTGAVFMGGARIIDSVDMRAQLGYDD